mgnify:CR=1 FL=1
MKPTPNPSAKSSADERPLISRSTIVILLSYQVGMLIGNGIPATPSAVLYLGVTVALISYLGMAIVRQETLRRREANKQREIAKQVDRRIQTHIVDPPVRTPKAPFQTQMRKNTDFVPVVSNWA